MTPSAFLYSDGELLVAYAHRRAQHDGVIASPGLWMLQRHCAVDPDVLAEAGIVLESEQMVRLFSSVPLSDEAWRLLDEGEVAFARHELPESDAPSPAPPGNAAGCGSNSH